MSFQREPTPRQVRIETLREYPFERVDGILLILSEISGQGRHIPWLQMAILELAGSDRESLKEHAKLANSAPWQIENLLGKQLEGSWLEDLLYRQKKQPIRAPHLDRCPKCGNRIEKICSFKDFLSQIHRLYRCDNCCGYWSEGWGKELRRESEVYCEEIISEARTTGAYGSISAGIHSVPCAAIANGDTSRLMEWLDEGFAIDAPCLICGCRMLEQASEHEQEEAAQILLSKGAKINAVRFTGGGTALHTAVDVAVQGAINQDGEPAPDTRFVRFLLSNGADPRATDDWGNTPLDIAKEYGINAEEAFSGSGLVG